MHARFVIGCALILGGCATGSTIPDPREIDAALQAAFAGQPVTRMLQRYGAPEQQQMVGGMKVLTWRRTDWLDFGSGPRQYRCQIDAYLRTDGVTVDGVVPAGQAGSCQFFRP